MPVRALTTVTSSWDFSLGGVSTDCYAGRWTSGVAIPIAQFNTRCWDNSGAFATSSLLFKRVDILVPSNAPTDAPFAYCLTNVSVE